MPSLLEFFAEKIKSALQEQSLKVSVEVEFYLAQLLSHYAVSENVFVENQDGSKDWKALAMQLYDATFDPNKRVLHLKNLGDSALYQAGVFSERLTRQSVSLDYYISMGGQAYNSLAHLTTHSEKSLSKLYAELAECFPELVETIQLSCESETAMNDHDLIRLFERYQKTKSQKARKILEEKGLLLPLKDSKNSLQ